MLEMDSIRFLKLNRRLNIVLLILLITFFVLYINYGTNPCDDCRFDIDGKTLKFKEFFQMFHEKCLVEIESQLSSLDISNLFLD